MRIQLLHQYVGRERKVMGVGVYYSTKKARERWVLLKIPRCDIDGMGEVK